MTCGCDLSEMHAVSRSRGFCNGTFPPQRHDHVVCPPACRLRRRTLQVDRNHYVYNYPRSGGVFVVATRTPTPKPPNMRSERTHYLLFVLLGLFTVTASAQSPRLQLLEVFDNTSIPPDIAANIHLDPLMAANQEDMVCVKYHVAWGSETGTDPMNLDNPDQIAARVAYYGITADPHGVHDGGMASEGLFNDQPLNFTQEMIDARSTQLSPFTIDVSHVLSADHDSIRTHTVITRTGTSSEPLTVQVLVLEKTVRFFPAPGLSGETEFLNVVKRMLPDEEGTTLPALNVGESYILDLDWELANVYDTTQLSVVSFVQDDATHEVLQTGYGAVHPQIRDVGITALNNLPEFGCGSNDALAVLFNAGIEDLTTCTINYRIDGDAPVGIPWSGVLAPNESVEVPFSITALPGMHEVMVYTSAPNGQEDIVHFNDTIVVLVIRGSAGVSIPLQQGFDATFPPTDWAYNHFAEVLSWEQAEPGGFGNSDLSAMLNFYDIPSSGVDDLYAPVLDLSTVGGAVACSFNVAYAQYDAVSLDTLEVNVSTDCGTTWTNVYTKSAGDLATAPTTADFFVPTASQWRTEIVDLADYGGEAEVQLQFRGKSGFGNAVYVDDVNIGIADGIHEVEANTMTAAPNPFSTSTLISFDHEQRGTRIVLLDALGHEVRSMLFSGRTLVMDRSDLKAGVYLVRIIRADGQVTSRKLCVE